MLHNDDVNGFDFVIEVLRKVFHYERLKAELLTLQAHRDRAKGDLVGQPGSSGTQGRSGSLLRAGPEDVSRGRPAAARDIEPLPG